MRPKARTEALIVETLPDETLVYDERKDKAHCLNQTASLVWRMSDGKHTVEQIARALSVPGARDIVWTTLNDLRKAGLLEENGGRFERPLSRRELGKRVAAGAAMAAIPAILTVGAPTAAAAASCLALNLACSASSQCCSGCCKRVGSGAFLCQATGSGSCI